MPVRARERRNSHLCPAPGALMGLMVWVSPIPISGHDGRNEPRDGQGISAPCPEVEEAGGLLCFFGKKALFLTFHTTVGRGEVGKQWAAGLQVRCSTPGPVQGGARLACKPLKQGQAEQLWGPQRWPRSGSSQSSGTGHGCQVWASALLAGSPTPQHRCR